MDQRRDATDVGGSNDTSNMRSDSKQQYASGGAVSGSELWAHRTGPNTIAVRRGFRVVLSLVGDDEAEAVAQSILRAVEDER